MKKLFFVFLICYPIFSVVLEDGQYPSPARNAALQQLDQERIDALNRRIGIAKPKMEQLLGLCIERINILHRIFAGQSKSWLMTADIKRIFQEELVDGILGFQLLADVFCPFFTERKHFTPLSKETAIKVMKSIQDDSPHTFCRRGPADLDVSLDDTLATYLKFLTHDITTFYIQQEIVNPHNGYAFYRKSTFTIEGNWNHEPYNIECTLFDGENPKSGNGKSWNWHHCFQNMSSVVPLSEKIHTGYSKQLHKSNALGTKIDRNACKSAFSYMNRMLGLIWLARSCAAILEHHQATQDQPLEYPITQSINWIKEYRGNLFTISNPGATVPRSTDGSASYEKAGFTMQGPTGFVQRIAEIINDSDQEDALDAGIGRSRSASLSSGHTTNDEGSLLESDVSRFSLLSSITTHSEASLLGLEVSRSSTSSTDDEAPITRTKNRKDFLSLSAPKSKRMNTRKTPPRIGKENREANLDGDDLAVRLGAPSSYASDGEED